MKPSVPVVNRGFIKRVSCRLDLMADGAPSAGGYGVEKAGVVAVHYIAGCPDGQSRTNVPAVGGVGVLIH